MCGIKLCETVFSEVFGGFFFLRMDEFADLSSVRCLSLQPQI